MQFDILVTPELVKAEAAKRIESQFPLWKQLNVVRAGGAELVAMSAVIDGIRAASDALEVMSPIPSDYTSNNWWTS